MSAGYGSGEAAILTLKKPSEIDIFAPIAPFRGTSNAASRNIDENRSLPYKPRQLSAMARSDRGGSIGPETARFGPASITGLTSLIRQIAGLACQLSAENYP